MSRQAVEPEPLVHSVKFGSMGNADMLVYKFEMEVSIYNDEFLKSKISFLKSL